MIFFFYSAFVVCHFKARDWSIVTNRQLNSGITNVCGQARDLLAKGKTWKVKIEDNRK